MQSEVLLYLIILIILSVLSYTDFVSDVFYHKEYFWGMRGKVGQHNNDWGFQLVLSNTEDSSIHGTIHVMHIWENHYVSSIDG